MIGALNTCDVFFLTYDEPRADLSWERVRSLIPRAQRVHGIKGFDAAYKACAALAKTERFFTVDGDNELQPSFAELRFDAVVFPEDSVLSWSARNSVNGLRYGNGGVKNWPRRVVMEMKTHESANAKASAVDFCFQLNYFQMPETLSTALIHETPYQAFRSGFREGVKMCLEKGERPDLSRASLTEHVWPENLNRLRIWASVGSDVENGLWAIYGARLGCQMLCSSNWNHELIRDYDWFDSFWGDVKTRISSARRLEKEINYLGNQLHEGLGLFVPLLDPAASAFFKSVYVSPPRNGPMFK